MVSGGVPSSSVPSFLGNPNGNAHPLAHPYMSPFTGSMSMHATTAATTNRRPTAPICYDFVKNQCTRGTDCKYSHDYSSILLGSRPPGRNPYVMCMDFARGKCARGAGCRYAHGDVLPPPNSHGGGSGMDGGMHATSAAAATHALLAAHQARMYHNTTATVNAPGMEEYMMAAAAAQHMQSLCMQDHSGGSSTTGMNSNGSSSVTTPTAAGLAEMVAGTHHPQPSPLIPAIGIASKQQQQQQSMSALTNILLQQQEQQQQRQPPLWNVPFHHPLVKVKSMGAGDPSSLGLSASTATTTTSMDNLGGHVQTDIIAHVPSFIQDPNHHFASLLGGIGTEADTGTGTADMGMRMQQQQQQHQNHHAGTDSPTIRASWGKSDFAYQQQQHHLGQQRTSSTSTATTDGDGTAMNIMMTMPTKNGGDGGSNSNATGGLMSAFRANASVQSQPTSLSESPLSSSGVEEATLFSRSLSSHLRQRPLPPSASSSQYDHQPSRLGSNDSTQGPTTAPATATNLEALKSIWARP